MAGHKNTLGFNSQGGQQVAALAVDSQDGTLGVLPSAGSVIQAGAFGAAFSGVTTGIADTMKVRDGEMTHQEAVHDIAKSSLQGAATMATASTIAHMARTNPVLGLGVLALAGLGLWASGRKKPQRTNPEPPDPACPPHRFSKGTPGLSLIMRVIINIIPLIKDHPMAECVHNIPGRARFRIPALRHSETVAAALRQRLSGTDGIAEVDIRRQSASLIVRYNPDALDADTLHILVLGHRPAPMAPQPPPAPRKDTAREIVPPSNRTRQALRYVSGVAGAAALNAILERVVKTGIGVVLRSARIPI